ncbi:MAG: DUF924 domain-containing protein [Gammaproteobacteria bacterium]|nr:DUF924 domain-containing protein [Gammaproteobacteria bacterium]MCP5426125.1 DUF924 domain-containing protein [Gammaproteobacteria bacterium]
MTDTPLIDSEKVLEFWFAETTQPFWFQATPAFDQALRDRFLSTYQAAANGALTDWQQTPRGALALVIMLDQFPLNMFRGQVESFATESAAREVADLALARGFDRNMTSQEKMFMYLPFMHSETLIDQDWSVRLFEELGLEKSTNFALHHRALIARFGRFPHRNSILGRPSTSEEIAYLASTEAFHG